jgi:acetate kinase
MRILAVNVGSTSVKLRVIGDADDVAARVDLPSLAAGGRDRLGPALTGLGRVDAVGHRIVHGGSRFTGPVRLDEAVIAQLGALTDLAPLHQPPALEAVAAVGAALPGVPSVASFDTAFHATMAPEASTYAIPQRWRDLGARRYGFHGLSHAWASRRAAQLTHLPPPGRVVTCHLGGGASLAAVAGGRSVDTTMGFTPLDGLVMATRCGSVDPGLILWLQQQGLAPDDISDDLEHRSGLLALCGSGNMSDVVTRAGPVADGHSPADGLAALALGVYLHRLRAGIAAMVAALGGLDALVFTGGVGEHSPVVREATCGGLGFLGVALDGDANSAAQPDQDISVPTGRVRVLVVEAREDLEIVHGVRGVLAPGNPGGPG